ncbi:hypothetical protein [Streptomyces sp. NBC_01361]|uniref:hypothetical protein n=1 Tax=Streptomyces sp. NBC_01361 TaxID=2903838 RepID=UPI002E355D7C|nr:hypothetical protein [Streptomyces sp. NBC_01361]
MTPRPEDAAKAKAKAREDLKKSLAAAKAKRDKVFEQTEKAREAADAEMWKTVNTILDGSYHGARTDAVGVLGVTRDYILKKTKEHS